MSTSTEEKVIDIDTLDPPGRDRALTRVEEPSADDDRPHGGGWVVLLCAALAILWIAGCAAYLLGYSGVEALLASTPAQLAGLAFVAFGPALFVFIAGIAAQQMMRFSAQARLVTTAARRLTRPERVVEEETRSLSTVLTSEVQRVNTGMDAALTRLGAMEEVIRHHADSLAAAARRADEQSRSLIDDLRAEREALTTLADVLDAKAKQIAEAISEQSRMVARAAELAEGAASEGQAKIETSAEALKTASTELVARSDEAAGALDSQRRKLNTLAESFAEQGKSLGALYESHREEMDEASRTLREEQKRIASALDFHRAELGELVKVAGKGADDMTEATRAGGEVLRGAVEDALSQAQELGEMILGRTESLSQRQEERLKALEDAADKARAASDAAAAALEAQAAGIQGRVEQLGEATFDAATRAEKVFERRIDEANHAISRVARMADEADSALAARFDRSLETWRQQLAEVERRIDSVGDNLGQFPEAARERVTELETAVRTGVENLRSAARSAADEAREIDSALQARMRHNYELLSEFVLRMGSLGGGSGGRQPPVFPDLPDPLQRAGDERGRDRSRSRDTDAPREPSRASRREEKQEEQEEPPKFESGLSWRDIVSSMRETEEAPRREPFSYDRPERERPERPERETRREPEPEPRAEDTAEDLGADPSALSPAGARDAAHARRSAGIDAMRESVREHAPAHVALLSRTIERDEDLRGRVRAFVGKMEEKVSSAAREDRPDHLIELLGATPGRGYLLLSAALGGA